MTPTFIYKELRTILTGTPTQQDWEAVEATIAGDEKHEPMHDSVRKELVHCAILRGHEHLIPPQTRRKGEWVTSETTQSLAELALHKQLHTARELDSFRKGVTIVTPNSENPVAAMYAQCLKYGLSALLNETQYCMALTYNVDAFIDNYATAQYIPLIYHVADLPRLAKYYPLIRQAVERYDKQTRPANCRNTTPLLEESLKELAKGYLKHKLREKVEEKSHA